MFPQISWSPALHQNNDVRYLSLVSSLPCLLSTPTFDPQICVIFYNIGPTRHWIVDMNDFIFMTVWQCDQADYSQCLD
jgi:hypothetical protein